jgi:phage baseplate assembly protein gpV
MAIRELVELTARVADLERRMSGQVRHGTVAQVDMDMFRVRLDMGLSHGGSGRVLSPWVPYAQFAGALRSHTPPEIGQQFTVMAPSGDWQQSVAMPLHWSGGVPSPSDRADENVFTFGNIRIELRGDEVVFRHASGATAVFNAEGLQVDARLHVTQGIRCDSGISGSAVWPPVPVSVPSIRGPGVTGTDTIPTPVPGTT